MPRFFFHFRRGRIVERDESGVLFPSAEGAFLDAFRTIPAMLPELHRQKQDPRDCAFEIFDDRGRKLFDLRFTEAFSRRAAISPGRHHRIDRAQALSSAIADEIATARLRVQRSREIMERSRERGQVAALTQA